MIKEKNATNSFKSFWMAQKDIAIAIKSTIFYQMTLDAVY